MTLRLGKPYCGGRYVLTDRLDRESPGGYASVYLADDREDKIQVAVKESLPQNQTAKRRFERERRIQQRLGGDHVVRALGVDEFGSSRCLILEYLPGGSLAEEATRSQLSIEQAPSIVADVLRALATAHAAGIVHRDVKPGNVLLDGEGRAKLGDFGSAFDPSEPPLTGLGEILGTYDWMAPQQAIGEGPDPRDDLFAVGLLLYYLLTGDRPRMSQAWWRPRLDRVDPRYRDIVQRATAEARDDRYRSANEMLAALEVARGRPLPSNVRVPRRLTLDDLRLLTNEQRVRILFRKLGYPVTQDRDFTVLTPADLDLQGSVAELVHEVWTIASFGGDLFVLLLRLRDTRGSTIRAVAGQFLRRPAQFLLICTDTFDRFVFVNPRRGGPGQTPRLHKLVLERQHPTRHALDILENLTCTTNIPAVVFGRHCQAFDVDQVTDAFYRKYAALVRQAKARIRSWNQELPLFNDDRTLDVFTQRLFSRLLFLYFLQKKGWLAGQPDFLTRQYHRAVRDGQNFYRMALEPLFFEILNTDRPAGESRFGPIPYLNGGLFERDFESDQIYIDNELFDAASEHGILGFLNDYDFTVEEDTPAEVEVALDPEMLGKVFENLLEELEREQTGVFYTPRPIVHYMCRESLILYLREQTGLAEDNLRELFVDQERYRLGTRDVRKVERALDQVRVLDPAVGSGAFLVGMLQSLVQVKHACKIALGAGATRTGSEVAGWKREIIQRSLYGVDIKEEAVEIARLRLWLSLVVDLDVEVQDVEPLPNLDFRVRRGNSLLEAFENGNNDQHAFDMPSQEMVALRRSIAEQRDDYFVETDPKRKLSMRRAVEDGERQLAEQWLKDRLAELRPEADRRQMALAALSGRSRAGDTQLQRLQDRIARYQSLLDQVSFGKLPIFSYRLNFSEVFDGPQPGFDIVIANPPYVRVQEANKLAYQAELKAIHGWLDDLYVHFLFRGFELARAAGIIVYITADTYFTIGTKQRLRDLLLEHRLLTLARCDPFKATVDTAVLIARKERAQADDPVFFANGNRRSPALFVDLGPLPEWQESRTLTVDGETQTVLIGSFEPIPQYLAPATLYRKTLKRAFFEPSLINLTLYQRFMPAMRVLYDAWWRHIATSGAMTKNAAAVAEYCADLRPGDITLLGLVTEGGVGLQTSDNPRFLAHLEGTPWGDENERRLAALEEHWRTRQPDVWRRYQELLTRLPRYEAVDALRLSMPASAVPRTLGIGRMTLYRTVSREQIADPDKLTDHEKHNGIADARCWVPFRKGDRKGNRWLSDEPLYIDWDCETVRYFYANSGKKGAYMPVVRNPHLYFEDLVSWSRIGRDTVIRARLFTGAVFDSGTPAIRSIVPQLPAEYLLAVLNSPLATYFCKAFLNNTKFELNDLRMLPLVVPDDEQRRRLVGLVREVMEVQRRVLAGEVHRSALAPNEAAINTAVLALYGIDPTTTPAEWAWAEATVEDGGSEADVLLEDFYEDVNKAADD